MKRVMIAGTRSGCGKTTVTCAILQALINRGCDVTSFKCGPDYIDPMFHSSVIGAPAYHLDGFFCSRDTVGYLLQKYTREIAVIEGVMGFYDGVGHAVPNAVGHAVSNAVGHAVSNAVGRTASSYELAQDTRTPVILVIDGKGIGQSLGAVMYGYLHYQTPNPIIGFIFNRLPDSMVETAQQLCNRMHVTYFGRLPVNDHCRIESRHLGLVTAAEIADLKKKMQALARLAEEHLRLDALLDAAECPSLPACQPPVVGSLTERGVKIAVACDKAFCFYYQENLDLLREIGCEILPFSPLTDTALPRHASGLLLGGGYPELYAETLSQNSAMRRDIREKISAGLPVLAECGGFMYLHREMETKSGEVFPMAGVIDGKCYPTDRLRRFGYIHVTAAEDNLICRGGDTLPAHEFHYWDSDSCGSGFTARKASSGMEYACLHATDTLCAGFPHFYFYAHPDIALRFARRCEIYHKEHNA